MQFKRILVPVDFSTQDGPLLEMAAALARDSGGTLLIVHVHESPMSYGGEMYTGKFNPSEEQLREMLAATVPVDASIPVEHHLLTGGGTSTLADTDVAREIARFADEQDIDLIVINTHGRTGLRRMLMGSVAEKVVAVSERPVLSMRLPHRV